MASRVLPGLGLSGFWGLGEDGWNTGMDSNLLSLSSLTHLTVISSVASVPASPSNGDIHLITGGADAKKIAVRDNGAWVYIPPRTGYRLYDTAAGLFKFYNGSAWVAEIPDTSVSGCNLLGVASAYGPSSLDFTGLTSTYESYLLVIAGLRPSANNDINLRLKDESSGSFYSGASDYQFTRGTTIGTTESHVASSAATSITLCASVVSLSSHGLSASVWINCLGGRRASVHWSGLQVVDAGGALQRLSGAGYFRGSATTQLDGIRLLPASGTFSEGTAKLYGFKNSV